MNQFNFKNILFILLCVLGISSCEKAEYSFGDLNAPSDLSLVANVAGLDNANPNGNGTGNVAITASANNAITYKIDFGNGDIKMVPSGAINYKYSTPGVNEYIITVSAIGRGGVISNLSKKVTVFVSFEIPSQILQSLTGGSSKIWIMDKDASGHFGVGQPDMFWANWYSASPNQRDGEGMYDDEITFAKDANNQVSINVQNNGDTWLIGEAVSFYGFSGGAAKYPVTTIGSRKLTFMDSNSGSTSEFSTLIQFMVPGNGIVAVGVGGNTYEILELTETTMHLRTINFLGAAWYQKFKVKQ
ncbi:MAG: PKD domain-containing protein [bacterium]|jgi:hypothetical protein